MGQASLVGNPTDTPEGTALHQDAGRWSFSLTGNTKCVARRVKKLKRPFETVIDDRMTVSLADISNKVVESNAR